MTLCCRFCFKENVDNFSIFKYVKNNYLPRIVYLISGVKVSKEHEPGAQICQHCTASVLVAQNIILRIQESEEYFQFQRLQDNCLQNNTPTKYLNTNVGESLLNDYETSQAASTCSEAEETLNFVQSSQHVTQPHSKLLLTEVQPISSNATEEIDISCSPLCEPASKRTKKDGITAAHVFNCEQCDYSTKIGKRIIEHKQNKHGVCDPNIYACNLCTQRFSWKPTLYRHIELDHKTLPADKKYLCNECGRAYMREMHLVEHIKQRHGPRNFKCPDPLCEQSFTRTFTLRRHFITSHTEQTNRRYHCVDCDKYFKIYDQWKYHNEVIHKNETIYCPQCGYPFRFREKLNEHLLKDVCKRSIVPCSYCQRRFTTKSGLREHVRNIHNIY